jgi:hypothetical protein
MHAPWTQRLSATAATAALTAALVLSPCSGAEARRLSADEQKVVDLFTKNTASVVNITNLSSRCALRVLIHMHHQRC